MTKHLYTFVGGLVLVLALAPLLVQLVAAVLPLVVIGGLVVVVLRLVWFYTSRY